MGTAGPAHRAAAVLAWRRKDDAEEETVKLFEGLPWWVKWVAVPLIAIVVFGGLIASAIGFLFWLLFNVLGNLRDPVAMVMQCLVALPFFVLAFSSRRFPRVTGVILLAFAIFAFVAFDLHTAFLSSENFGKMAVILLLWLPLTYSGVSLLPVRAESPEG